MGGYDRLLSSRGREEKIPGERREAGRGCYSPRKSLAMAGSGCAVFQAHPHTSMTGVRLTH